MQDSKIHGAGQFANQIIEEGEVVMTTGGLIVPKEELENYKKKQNISWLSIPNTDSVLVTVCSKEMNASHLNHSCEPNLVFVFPAWRSAHTIKANEELTVDYSLLGYRPEGQLIFSDCRCGSPSCRKNILT